MKKIMSLLILGIILVSATPVFAINIGTYKTETEYGLLDGFKVNWKRKDKETPFIEPREESTQKEKEADLKYYKDKEYEYTKYMYEGQSIL